MARLPACRCGDCPGCRQRLYQRHYRARTGESAGPDLLRLTEAADLLHYSPQTVRRYVKRGILPGIWRGEKRGWLYIRRTDVLAFKEAKHGR